VPTPTPEYKISANTYSVMVEFSKQKHAQAFRQTEFASRLLHSFAPDSNGIWQPGSRLNCWIVGLPKTLNWSASSDKVLIGQFNGAVDHDEITLNLSRLIDGLITKDRTSGARYEFSVTDGQAETQYKFNDRARVLIALCVLYDLEWHSRKELEVWINPDFTDKLPSGANPRPNMSPHFYYGDPSKTADVLRNEGWSRQGDGASMSVESKTVFGATMQCYRISTRDQAEVQQVRRSVIKKAWRRELFRVQDYTCQICLQKYEHSPEELSPDHRIPVIYEADNLNEDNFKSRLMTLCRYCNQQKREVTKRFSADYNWEESPWAFPERFRLETAAYQVKAFCLQHNITEEDGIVALMEMLVSP